MQHFHDNMSVGVLVVAFAVVVVARILNAQRASVASILTVCFLFSAFIAYIAWVALSPIPLWVSVLSQVNTWAYLLWKSLHIVLTVLLFAICGTYTGIIFTRDRGAIPSIRRIPGLNAVDEAIGRATEMGRPVLFIPGIGSIGDATTTVPTLQGLSILGYVAKAVAKFGNRVIVAALDPVTIGIAEEILRDTYQQAGRPELFNDDDIRFLGGQQFAFASGVAGILEREKIAASFLFGSFFAESLVLAEVGQRVGAIQIAGTEQRTQIPFFIAACDYVIIGDEFYAASAYLSRNPTLLGSIVAQDYCKIAMLIAVIVGVVCATVLGHSHAGLFTIHGLSSYVQTIHLGHFAFTFRWPGIPSQTIHYRGIPHWLTSVLTLIKKGLTA